MNYNKVTANLMTKNIKETLDFYTEKLEFTLLMSTDEWLLVGKDDIAIMFQDMKSLIEEYTILENDQLNPCLSLFIEVSEIEKIFASLPKDINILKPISTTPYGKQEFAIADNNGYVLTFAQ